MPTHTDNRHFGTVINDGFHVQGDMNAVDGIGLGAIMDYVPSDHDISNQCDGQNKVFLLDPPIRIGTFEHAIVFLNGQALTPSTTPGGSDYFITLNGANLVFGDADVAPPPGSSLIVSYIEASSQP